MFPEAVPLDRTQVAFVQTWDEIQEFMRWLSQSRDILAVDTETTGLNPFEAGARIRLAQFGDVNSGFAIDVDRWSGLVQHVLEVYEGDIAFHNVGFDAKWIQVQWPKIKFPWSRITDTMILARIDHEQTSAALKPLSAKYFGGLAVAGAGMLEETMKNGGWDWATVPLEAPAYSIYSALDVILTARLYRHLKHIKTGSTARISELEHNVRRIATGMEIRGMAIDRPYCEEKLVSLEDFVTTTKEYCAKEYGVQIGSTQQLAKWFLEAGEPLPDRTQTGAPKMSKDVLEGLSHKYTLADLALKTRKADKIRGTYFENLIKFSKDDGSVHPQINTIQAATGRMSITDPALQTLPASGEGKTVRQAFLPREGNAIYSADYSSIEARLTSHFSHDTAMAEAFREVDEAGGDFFTILGRSIFGPEFVKSDPRRRLVKNVMYASAYGAGVPQMAITAGVAESEMQPVADALFQNYRGIKGGQRTAADTAKRNQRDTGILWIETPFGRKLRVPEERIYTASNYLTQGHAAELLKQAMVNCDYAGIGDFLALPVHDELVFDVPVEYDSVDFKEQVRECMEIGKDAGYLVPLPVVPEGPHPRWGLGDK